MVGTVFCFKYLASELLEFLFLAKYLWSCTIVALLTLIARLNQSSLLHTLGLIRGVINKLSSRPAENILNNNTDQLLDFVLMLPEVGPNGQRRLEVLWRALVRDLADHSNFLPVSIEIEEYFDHLLC